MKPEHFTAPDGDAPGDDVALSMTRLGLGVVFGVEDEGLGCSEAARRRRSGERLVTCRRAAGRDEPEELLDSKSESGTMKSSRSLWVFNRDLGSGFYERV